MSMIEHQLKEIRNMASVLHEEKRYAAEEIMRQAADTIESLSAKLAAANMERPSRYCGEEKKLIEAMAEEIENCYGRETQLSEMARKVLGAFAED